MSRRLLPAQVRSIRRAIDTGASYQSIAVAHGTYAMVVANIHRGRAYKGVGLPEPVTRRDVIDAYVRALKRRGITQGAQYWAALADLRECDGALEVAA